MSSACNIAKGAAGGTQLVMLNYLMIYSSFNLGKEYTGLARHGGHSVERKSAVRLSWLVVSFLSSLIGPSRVRENQNGQRGKGRRE